MNDNNLERFSVNLKYQKVVGLPQDSSTIFDGEVEIGDQVCLKGTNQIITVQKINVKISENLIYDYAGYEKEDGPLYFFNKKSIKNLVSKNKKGGRVKWKKNIYQ